MHAKGEKEVPELQDFRKWRCASTQSEDRGKSVDLGGEFVCVEEEGGEMGFAVRKDTVDEVKAGMDARHGGSNIHGNVSGKQRCEEGVRLALAAGGVEERGGEDIDSLDVGVLDLWLV